MTKRWKDNIEQNWSHHKSLEIIVTVSCLYHFVVISPSITQLTQLELLHHLGQKLDLLDLSQQAFLPHWAQWYGKFQVGASSAQKGQWNNFSYSPYSPLIRFTVRFENSIEEAFAILSLPFVTSLICRINPHSTLLDTENRKLTEDMTLSVAHRTCIRVNYLKIT